VQRDYGNRSDRKLARLKYTIDHMGVDAFKAEAEKRAEIKFEPAKKYVFTKRQDEYGWHQNHEGLWYYTAFIENGRIYDDENVQFKQAFYEIAQSKKAMFRFTCNQHLIIGDIKNEDKAFVEGILSKYSVIDFTNNASTARKSALACVALNTCPLALAEAQRYLPSLMTKIEALLARHKLGDEEISIRMTGCPNGCARPYISEIGFIGTALGKYNLMLGADVIGTRLNKLYKENLNEEQILSELDVLFQRFATSRKTEESFGDFVVRERIIE
jgi:sulfite reductase (NADPH) hemoprotein beta-component